MKGKEGARQRRKVAKESDSARAPASKQRDSTQRNPPARQFQRTEEDFACEVCGQLVKGDGYTNHCPACLWSKHVDINPGDRLATCQALLRPAAIEIRGGEKILTHQCEGCGESRRIRLRDSDSLEAVLLVMQGKPTTSHRS